MLSIFTVDAMTNSKPLTILCLHDNAESLLISWRLSGYMVTRQKHNSERFLHNWMKSASGEEQHDGKMTRVDPLWWPLTGDDLDLPAGSNLVPVDPMNPNITQVRVLSWASEMFHSCSQLSVEQKAGSPFQCEVGRRYILSKCILLFSNTIILYMLIEVSNYNPSQSCESVFMIVKYRGNYGLSSTLLLTLGDHGGHMGAEEQDVDTNVHEWVCSCTSTCTKWTLKSPKCEPHISTESVQISLLDPNGSLLVVRRLRLHLGVDDCRMGWRRVIW